jgi:mannosyltransferase OCH1-like enzyme
MISYLWNMKPNETRSPNASIIKHNSQFIPEHQIIGPDDITPLVSKFSTELKDIWDTIPHWIIKCDLGRLLYIYYHGGIYMDCDCIILKPFQTSPVVLFEEKTVSVHLLGPREKKYGLRIANYAFASVAEHPFMKEVIDECIRRLKTLKGTPSDKDILWVCGPDVLTTIYHEKKSRGVILMDKSYLRHFMSGSWR